MRSLALDLLIPSLIYYCWVLVEGFGPRVIFREEKLGSLNDLGGIKGSIGVRWCSMLDPVLSRHGAGMGGLPCMLDFLGF